MNPHDKQVFEATLRTITNLHRKKVTSSTFLVEDLIKLVYWIEDRTVRDSLEHERQRKRGAEFLTGLRRRLAKEKAYDEAHPHDHQ